MSNEFFIIELEKVVSGPSLAKGGSSKKNDRPEPIREPGEVEICRC